MKGRKVGPVALAVLLVAASSSGSSSPGAAGALATQRRRGTMSSRQTSLLRRVGRTGGAWAHRPSEPEPRRQLPPKGGGARELDRPCSYRVLERELEALLALRRRG